MARKQPTDNGIAELKMALKQKSLGRLYFFHGEETFLLHHYLDQMKKVVLEPLTESFNYHRLNSETADLCRRGGKSADDGGFHIYPDR